MGLSITHINPPRSSSPHHKDPLSKLDRGDDKDLAGSHIVNMTFRAAPLVEEFCSSSFLVIAEKTVVKDTETIFYRVVVTLLLVACVQTKILSLLGGCVNQNTRSSGEASLYPAGSPTRDKPGTPGRGRDASDAIPRDGFDAENVAPSPKLKDFPSSRS